MLFGLDQVSAYLLFRILPSTSLVPRGVFYPCGGSLIGAPSRAPLVLSLSLKQRRDISLGFTIVLERCLAASPKD